MKSSKLIATRRARLLLVRRRKDKMWTLPGGKRKKPRESAKACLRRELREELPALRVRQTKLLGKIKNGRPGKRATNDHAIFTARKVTGKLVIGDKGEIDRVQWVNPARVRLTRTARQVCHNFLGEVLRE
jgi:8-oxo-dGTP diphosphatase